MKKLVTILILLLSLNAYAGSDTLNTPFEKMCTPGYSTTVRDVTVAEKKILYANAGVPFGDRKLCKKGWEADHRIALSLNGSNDPSNLQLQARCTYAELTKGSDGKPVWKGLYGAYQKDALEFTLHDKVCVKKTMDLGSAQKILREWKN